MCGLVWSAKDGSRALRSNWGMYVLRDKAAAAGTGLPVLAPFHHRFRSCSAGKSGIFEAVLSTNLSHPNIVHTYQYAFRPVSVSAPGRQMALCAATGERGSCGCTADREGSKPALQLEHARRAATGSCSI